jgi:threonine dehydratase
MHKKADFQGKKVGVILSGGNVDLKKLVEYWKSRTLPNSTAVAS